MDAELELVAPAHLLEQPVERVHVLGRDGEVEPRALARVAHHLPGLDHVLLERGAGHAVVCMERHQALGLVGEAEPRGREHGLEDGAVLAGLCECCELAAQRLVELRVEREAADLVQELLERQVLGHRFLLP